MKKIILFFGLVIISNVVIGQSFPPGISFQSPDVQVQPPSHPLGLSLSTTTSFLNNQAVSSFGLQRKKFHSVQPTGNDMNDEVSIWIKGYYQNSAVALPVLLGGYGWNSEAAHMIVDRNGSVGIGTLMPGSFANQNQVSYPRTYTQQDRVVSIISNEQPVLELGRSISTLSAGERVGAIFFSNITGQADAHRQIAGIWAEKGDFPTHPYLVGARLVFATKVLGGPAQNKMVFDEYGNLSIGTTTSSGYKLAVNGPVKARKIKVTQTEWPDFVFEASYKLKSLEELEFYISKYKHLPEIPAAADVQKNGLDVGENQAKLLQKIEELTLYLIDMNKKMTTQAKLIDKQQQQLARQEKELESLKNKSARTDPIKKEEEVSKVF
ncbi:hypothetical protein [Chitinophaga alhagiae]|uniref:hypothetical protein n=1 Tax=Chitinophaga alhagiae TaxID=2203219 RepID=UPI000E5B49D2|nr:hypothetical protein [Chitinophaga alhagiae]